MSVLRAECWGKLPTHGDFVRHRAGAELQEFDRWLQAGLLVARAKVDWGGAWPATPPLWFLRRAASGRVLLGALFASRDAAGRDYPFVVGGTLDVREAARPELTPLLAAQFLDAAAALGAWAMTGVDHRAVVAEVERLAVEVDPPTAGQRLAALLAATTLEQLVTGGGAPWEARHLLLDNAASLLGPRARPRFVVALPGVTDAAGAAVWLALVGALRGDPARFPTLATWTADPGGIAAGLRVLLVEPGGEHFLPLMLRHLPSDACDLAREGEGDPKLEREAQGRMAALAADGALPLRDLAPRLAELAR